MDLNSTSSTDPSNLTESMEARHFLTQSIRQWLWYTVPSCILTLGTFGNITILLVYYRIGFTPVNLFFRALAITDLFLLYSALLPYWLLKFSFFDLHDFTCKLYYYLLYSLGVVSAWLTAALAVQRALSVVWPHRLREMCTRRKSFVFIFGTVTFVLCLHSHMLYGLGLKSSSDSESPTCGTLTDNYTQFMAAIWPWFDLSFSLLPNVLIVISNCVLVWKLRTSMKSTMQAVGQTVVCERREARKSSVTKTLIAVSIAFFVLTIPTSLMQIISGYVHDTPDMELKAELQLIFIVTNLLWYSNSAINCYILFLTGTKFRTEFKCLLWGCISMQTVLDFQH